MLPVWVSQFVLPGAKHAAPRRKFTQEEDMRLRTLIDRERPICWEIIARQMEDRTPRQCRDRYRNYLMDNIASDPWTPEEDEIICARFREIGPKWVEIAKGLNGRSGNHVKNRWHKHLRKTLREAPCPDSTVRAAEGR
jgi:hypothetical protein